MSVRQLCSSDVHVIGLDDTAADAACVMTDRNVGALLVVDSGGTPVGMLTDRDLVVRVLALGLDPEAARVRRVMTPGVVCIVDTASVTNALGTMREGGWRRLPVVDANGEIVGILTADDIVRYVGETVGALVGAMDQQSPTVHGSAWSPTSAA